MNEETRIVSELKKLKNIQEAPNEEKFLKELRLKLSNRISTHRALRENTIIPWYLKFSTASAAAFPPMIVMPQKMIAVIFVICLLGFGAIAAASQNSLPGDALYPVKILAENVQSSLAFTPEAKIKIHTGFTAKRVAEVKTILEQKDTDADKLNLALINLQKNSFDAAAIIDEESQNGTDISKFAKNINDSFDKNAQNLKQIFKNKKASLKTQENELKNKIAEAKKINDQASLTLLGNQLDETKNIRKSIESSWNKNEESLRENAQKIENRLENNEKQLDKKNKAENAISEAKKEKNELLNEAQKKGILPETNMFAELDSSIAKAEDAFAQEQYDNSKIFAEAALLNITKIEKEFDEKDEEEKSRIKNEPQNANKQTGNQESQDRDIKDSDKKDSNLPSSPNNGDEDKEDENENRNELKYELQYETK